MIQITDKYNCCGCAACVQACPKQCISFEEDEQGFRYPAVDTSLCIDCHLCEKVCPVINQDEPRKPIATYAAINPDEDIRLKSSSGGIFSMIAQQVIDDGGVVFGAQFDSNFEVEHAYTDATEGISAFRGSKYLQSRIGNTYSEVRTLLQQGRKVLFTGTPCQIAGLRKFLGKQCDNPNLLTADVVCHGAPSPKVWRSYLDNTFSANKAGKNTADLSQNARADLSAIAFRDKSTGWKKYGFFVLGSSALTADENSVFSSLNTENSSKVLLHETLDKNLFMQVFLKDLCLRPACHRCPAKAGRSGSDITLGDYWGIGNHHPELDDDKGTSLLVANTAKGAEIISKLGANIVSTTYEQALAGNPALEHSAREHKFVAEFWKSFLTSGLTDAPNIIANMRPSIMHRCYHLVRQILSKIYHIIIKS